MVDHNRGMMKFDGADSPVALILSASVVASVVITLVWWALNYAYVG
ncbi:MAG: hypothetical protein HC924_07995 [Synechococcaceae cyanobacterium SM2_3_2]|nr:hypothetical protein [Synechococcaceae cyanobacterium SM2_3_2]